MGLRSIFNGAAVLAFCVLGLRVQGQTSVTWDGDSIVNGSIADLTNWSLGLAPLVSGTTYNATFGDAAGRTNVVINEADILGLSLGNLTLNNLTFTGSTAAYSFSGTGGATMEIDGTVNTAANPNAVVFNSSLNLVLGASAGPFTLASGSQVQINSAVSGAGGLTVAGGGTLTLGGAANYTGFTTVSGAATMNVVNGGSIGNFAGGLIVGQSSGDTSTLAISNSGLVQSGPYAYIGDAAGSSGTVTVNGDLSTLNTDAATLYVGLAGNGSIALTNAGVLSSTVTVVGSNSGSTGTVTVDGSGSTWTNSNYLYLGNSGSGSLSITNAGGVATAAANLGYYSGSSGTVTVDGSGSVWSNASALFLGDSGSGSVTVSNNGSMTTGTAYLGYASGGSGTLTLESGGTATVGGGTGTLYFYAGAGTLNIGAPAGSGALAGGALDAGEVYGSGTNGTVQFNTTSTSSSPYYFTKDGTSGAAPVDIGGLASVVNSAGYTVLSGTDSYSGATVVDGGTLAAGSVNAFGSASAVTVNGCGTLSLNGFDVTVGSIAGCSTSASISLGANTLINGANDTSTTFAGTISGTGALFETGTGTLTLTGANSYSGGTTIDTEATLQLGNGGTTGSILAGVVDNGTLAFDLSNCTTFCGPISGNGGVTVEDGTVTLMGTNTYSGTTSVNDARLKDGASGSFSPNSAVNLANDATLGVGYNETINGLSGDCSTTVCISSGSTLLTDGNNGSCNYTYSGTIMGSGALEIGSGGYQILTGSNTYTGGTTIDGTATLQIGNGGSTGSISGNVVDNGTLAFNLSNCSTFCGAICGTGGLLVESGSVTLVGANTYSGGTTIAAGATLQIGNGGTSGSITGDVLDSNTLAFDVAGCTTFCGAISGTGGITVENGTLTLMGGSNTYSGYTLVTGATLKDGQAGAFSPNSAVWLTNDAAVSVGYNETVNGIKGDCSTTICVSSGSTLLTDGYDGVCLYTYSGTVMGSGALEVGSGGFQILTGSNTYSGGTTIDSMATLQLGSGGTTGSIVGGVVDNGTLVFDLSSCTSFCAGITGSGGVLVENGTVTLSGTNTYSGTTSVNDARLQDGASGSFSSSSAVSLVNDASLGVNYDETINGLSGDCSTTVCISSGSTLLTDGYNGCCNYNYSGTIMGSGALEIGQNAYQILTGSNTYSGGTTIDCMATLQLGDGGSNGSIEGSVFDNGTLVFDLSSCTSFCGTICGSGQVVVDEGMVTLMGDNTYTGGTQLGAGTSLYVTNSGSLGTGALTTNSLCGSPTTLAASGGCVTLPNNIVVGGFGLSLNFSDSPKLTLTGTISDLDSLDALVINGPVDLEGNNTYSGGTTINNATVTVGTSTGLGTGAVTAIGSNLTFTCNSSPTLNCATIESDSVVNFNGALSALTHLTLAESTLNFNGASATLTDMVSDSSGPGNTINISGDTQLTFDVSGGRETDYQGTITDNDSGTGTLVVTGAGVLNLKGASSYGGGTTVNGGLLLASNGGALGSGPVTVNGLSALGVNTGVTIANQVTLNGGSIGGFGTFDPASADSISIQGGSMVIGGSGALSTTGGGGNLVVGTLSFGSNANLVLGGGGVLEFSIMNAAGAAGTDYSGINVAGNVNITANAGSPFTIQLVGVDSTNLVIGTANSFNPGQAYSWTLLSVTGTTSGFSPSAFAVDSSTYFSNSTGGGSFSVSDTGGDLTLNFTPVPEPSTWALMACGLFAAVGALVRRRRRA